MLFRIVETDRLRAFCLLTCLAGAFIDNAIASTEKYWELSPYRVRLELVVDDSSTPDSRLGSQLAAQLAKGIRANIYPLWATEISVAKGAEKQQVQDILQPDEDLTGEAYDLESLAGGCEKRIYLSIVLTRLGAQLSCREFDTTTRRWGEVHSRLVRQRSTLSANCLDLICEAFAPIASVRSLPDSETEVILSFRGSDLPQQTDLRFMTRSGETYQPVMLRTKSSGEVQPETIRDISWTYLSLREQNEDGWLAAVHTGTRRPFGVRRRGRIQHLALAIRKPTGNTRLRFYARHDSSQSLTGYEVFRREPDAKASIPLGLTDSDGGVDVLPGESSVTLLYLRSEGQLLAKVPVVPGAKPFVEVPIADDTARLRAQAALTSLSEQLIDTVAMRNILIARVRDRLNNGNIQEAQELFTTLDELPGLTFFNQEIRTAQNRALHRSKDPKVQARIDKLFADTRKLLGRFLSIKPIAEVQNEITAARRSESS